MPTIQLNAGICFNAAPGVSILDAAAAASIVIPYNCRTGRCRTCRCRVVKGETSVLSAETGLSDVEMAGGWILGCARMAVTDLLLEVDTLDGVTLPPPRTLPCRISGIEHLAPDVLRILLRLPPAAAFEYLPGQFVEVIGQGGIRRSYSLASVAAPGEPLELHIRSIMTGAMSDYWFNHARNNDLLRLHGPLGTFVLSDTADRDLIFLGTGTGIAPIKAMLESLPGVEPDCVPRSVTVLWGARTATSLYLDMAAISDKHRYIPVLSRPGSGWIGARGRVQEVLLGLKMDLSNATVYACGSEGMINDARDALLAAGLQGRRFHADAFVCSASPAMNSEPTT